MASGGSHQRTIHRSKHHGAETARAQGFVDFLFGGFQQRPVPPPELDNCRRLRGWDGWHQLHWDKESVNEGGGNTGHLVAFCVGLCDGHHFPLEQMVNGTPGETCRAICPYSKTKVFFGSEIGGAVAQDGEHYANLDAAFVYRKQLVTNCTCNGRNAFGLASFDVKNDPTLRPGDIVSTKDGLMAYAGKSGRGAIFTSVNPGALPVDIRPADRVRLPPNMDPWPMMTLGQMCSRRKGNLRMRHPGNLDGAGLDP